MHAIAEVDPKVTCYIAAIDEPSTLRAYKANVHWRIRQDRENSFRQAAREINASNVDIVVVQHEFGLYVMNCPATAQPTACITTTYGRSSWRSRNR